MKVSSQVVDFSNNFLLLRQFRIEKITATPPTCDCDAPLIVKISFIRFEDKLYTFCTLCLRILFTFHIHLNAISYQDFQVAVGQITWARKGYNLLFVNFTFFSCHFLK